MSTLRNLFEADARKEVLERLDKITSDSKPIFGKMTVDQMLWHVNRTMSYAMGEYTIPYRGNVFTRLFFKPMALGKMPFQKGKVAAIPEFIASGHYDMTIEKNRFREYIDRYAKSQDKKEWPASSILGKFTGENWARLDYKHIDHHFTQFGV